MHIRQSLSQRRRLALLGIKDAIGAAHYRLALRVRGERVIALSKGHGRRRWEGVVLGGRVGARAER